MLGHQKESASSDKDLPSKTTGCWALPAAATGVNQKNESLMGRQQLHGETLHFAAEMPKDCKMYSL